MNDRQQGGRPLFSTIEKWNPSLHTTFRLTWVQVWGIPPQAWNLKHIRSIVAVLGDMVDVDDDTEAKLRLDKARVLVKTQWRPSINHMVDVHISGDNGESFKVYAVEESGGGSHECRRRRYSLSGTSDEIFSNDTSLGHLSPPSSPCNHRHDQWTSPTRLGGSDDHHTDETVVLQSWVDDADEAQQITRLPSGSQGCFYPLGNGISSSAKTSTSHITPELVGSATTATYPNELSTAQGWVRSVGDATAAGGSQLNHDIGNNGRKK